MKNGILSFAVVVVFFAALASPAATVKARDANEKPLAFAAAHSDKQKRVNSCRARYRDCLRLKQIPSFECRYIYRDCINHIY